MMLTVSMTVSHLYQNLKNIKSVRSLKWASEGVIETVSIIKTLRLAMF